MCAGLNFDTHEEAVERYEEYGTTATAVPTENGTPVTKMYDVRDDSAVFIVGAKNPAVSEWCFGEQDIVHKQEYIQRRHQLAVSKQLV